MITKLKRGKGIKTYRERNQQIEMKGTKRRQKEQRVTKTGANEQMAIK